MSDLQTSVVLQDQLIGMAVGSYRIESLVGEGGMGLVYRARHELIDRCFAIKVLRPEVADDVAMVKSFLTEAQTLSAIKHPNIIDIVGFGLLPDGRQYMVMEYLDGHTLEQELATGPMPLERVLFVGEQILSALHAAHSVEVIHRDLKPSNVFVAKGSGGVEVIKLLDFGLSRYQPVAFNSLNGSAPAVTMVAGTPEYVSPEQAIGSAPNTSSDLYSFGAMLFELLTGRIPFEPGLELPNRVAALLHAHATERAPRPEQFGTTAPAELSELVAQLLEKSPSARPASAEVVRLRLESLRQELAPARPIQLVVRSPASIARMEVPRRRWPVAAALAALMAVVLPLGILLGSGSGSAAGAQHEAVPAPAQTTPAPIEVAKLPPPPLEVLEAIPAPEKPAALPRRTRAKAAPAPAQSECTPDARWRAAALINLQELQQLAAHTHWTEFEALEPELAKAVNSATTGAQCEAAERQIRKLARAWHQ